MSNKEALTAEEMTETFRKLIKQHEGLNNNVYFISTDMAAKSCAEYFINQITLQSTTILTLENGLRQANSDNKKLLDRVMELEEQANQSLLLYQNQVSTIINIQQKSERLIEFLNHLVITLRGRDMNFSASKLEQAITVYEGKNTEG